MKFQIIRIFHNMFKKLPPNFIYVISYFIALLYFIFTPFSNIKLKKENDGVRSKKDGTTEAKKGKGGTANDKV